MSLAAIVEALFEAGATREMIVAAVRAYESTNTSTPPIDDAAERRRAYDRERKRRTRDAENADMSGGIPVDKADAPKAEMSANSTGQIAEFHRTKRTPHARVRDITPTSELTGEDISSLRSDNSCGDDMFGGPPPPPAAAKQTDAVVAFDAYNAVATELGLPMARTLTEPRRKALKRRLAEVGADGWAEALNRLRSSPFCQGKTGTDFVATLDFLLQPKSLTKLIEGAYEGRSANGQQPHNNEPAWETQRRRDLQIVASSGQAALGFRHGR